jgi:hypothetical protein
LKKAEADAQKKYGGLPIKQSELLKKRNKDKSHFDSADWALKQQDRAHKPAK